MSEQGELGIEAAPERPSRDVDVLVENFGARWIGYWDRKAREREEQEERRTTPRNPVSSNVNRACPREMALAITEWRSTLVKEPDRLARMAHGDVDSKAARRLLEDLGYSIREVETAIPPVVGRGGKRIFTGRIDFSIVTGNHGSEKVFPCEVKGYHPNFFAKIFRVEDFDRSPWTRKAPDQLLVYLLSKGLPEGVICLYCLGRIRLIPVVLEDLLDRAEEALKAGEVVVESLASGTLPDYATDPEVCRSCWAFGKVCNPPLSEPGAEVFTDEEFVSEVEEMMRLEQAADRYEELRARNRDRVIRSGVSLAVCGTVGIKVTERTIPGKFIPAKQTKERVDKIVKFIPTGGGTKEAVEE